MVQPVIGNPTRRMPRTIENRPKDQKLLDDWMSLQRFVRQHPVVTNRRAKAAERCEQHSQAKDLEAGEWEKNQPDDGKNVNEDQVGKNAFLAVNRLPKRTVPRMRLWRLLRHAQFHVFSDDLQSCKIEGAGNRGPSVK